MVKTSKKKSLPKTKNPLNISIVAMKRLQNNTRITRQAQILSQRGHNVSVYSLGKPDNDVMEAMPSVQWYEVEQTAKIPLFKAREKLLELYRFQKYRNKFENFLAKTSAKILNHPKNIRDKLRKNRFFSPPVKKTTKDSKIAPLLLGKSHSLMVFILGGFLSVYMFIAKTVAFFLVAALYAGTILLLSVPYAFAVLVSMVLAMLYFLQKPFHYRSEITWSDIFAPPNINKILYKVLHPYVEFWAANFCANVYDKIKNNPIDIFIAHDNHTLHLAKKVKVKWPAAKIIFDAVEVFADLSSERTKARPKFFQKIFHAMYRKLMITVPDRVTTFGYGAARWFSQSYRIAEPDCILNCRNHVVFDKDIRVREDCGIKNDPDKKIIVCLNTLYPGQGLEQLFEAMNLLPDNIHLATIGWDRTDFYTEKCLAYAKENKFDHRIHYLPRRTTQDLVPYASGADLCVIPRQHNNSINNFFSMPNRVFDAMMARLPIVSSDLIDHKNLLERHFNVGICFDQNSPKEMAAAIKKMLKSSEQKKYRDNIEKAVKVLCWENEGRSFIDIIERVAAGEKDFKQKFYSDAFDVPLSYIPEYRGGTKIVEGKDYPDDVVALVRKEIKTIF